MSLFENIAFLNEGDQADAYRARKVKEVEEAKRKEQERYKNAESFRKEENRRRHQSERLNKQAEHIMNNISKQNPKSHLDAVNKSIDKINQYSNKLRDEKPSIVKGIERDMRRHPSDWKKDSEGKLHRESGLFESVDFLND